MPEIVLHRTLHVLLAQVRGTREIRFQGDQGELQGPEGEARPTYPLSPSQPL